MMVSRGFTLTEMLLVVAIVGLVASAATITLAESDTAKLDAAASEVVSLIRFARSESIRTGTAHGVSASAASQRVRPYIRSEPLGFPVYTVRNPVNKHLYDLQFDTDPGISDVAISTANFDFAGIGAQTLLGFNIDGVPKYESLGTIYLLISAEIRLSLGADERVINVAPMTGRVTVQ